MQADIVRAARVAEKMQGTLPAFARDLIAKITCPKLPWFEYLREFMRSLTFDDYDWSKCDRKGFAKTGLIQPRPYSEQLETLVCAVDTSGSIGQDELNEFAYHLTCAFQDSLAKKCVVIYCDAAVNHVQEFEKGDEVTLEPHGGGGTDFRPPFDYVEKHDINATAFVYFTDMFGTFPQKDPGYPVMWVTKTDWSEDRVPFGQVVNFGDK